MSITSSLFAGVSGLNSQGNVLSVIGDNIANISTVGFKAGQATFSSLVTGSGATQNGSGAISRTRLSVDQQGLIQSTGVATDIAISGQGFFVVKDDPDAGQGEYYYTRAGSFRQDDRGFFVNSAGFALQAWPLDSEGRLPGATGNLNTESSQLLDSVQSVSTRDISGQAFATSSISLGLNLNAGETVLQGAGDTAVPTTALNDGVGAADVLAVTTGTIERGDIMTVTLGDGTAHSFNYGGFARSDNITANSIFGASTTTQKFVTNAGAGATHLVEGDAFTVTTATSGAVTFTFREFAPNADTGAFNSLQTLADAIGAVPSLRARVSGGRLYVAPADAREAMTFADVGAATFISASSFETTNNDFNSTAVTPTNRFATLEGLANLVNESSGISATVESAASDSSLTISADDPLTTIQFADGGGAGGNLLTEFGLASTLFNPIYDATGTAGSNMASGDISPAFSRNIRIFDSLGTGHDIRISFVKSGNNEWLAEVYAVNPDEITTSKPDGQLAVGTILFNGDGSLRNVSSELAGSVDIVWTNGAKPSAMTLDLGTSGSPAGTEGATSIGLTDGLSQFNGSYNVQFVEQNGAGSGVLSSIEITEEGFIVANFTNGQSRRVFKLALATFPNANGMIPKAGNVFSASDASGEFSLNEAGTSGAGSISVASLESANTELADELTKLIVAQRAFQANTKIITTADDLLEELNRI